MFTDIISSPNCDIFGESDFASKQKLKQVVFSTIIYTDMSFHNQLCADFVAIDFKSASKNNISNNDLKVVVSGRE